MKCIIRNLYVGATLAVLLSSCAHDIVDLTGNIYGVVKDYTTGVGLANCNVSVTSSGKSVLTDETGLFEFKELSPEEYTLTFTKSGYESQTKDIVVTTGETTKVSASLKSESLKYGAIKGSVKDFTTGQSISNANVVLSPGGKSVLTDENGLFEFKELSPMQYSLTCSKSGYDEQSKEIIASAGSVSTVAFSIKPSSSKYGSVKGVVKDYADGHLIENCQISLMPGGKSFTTGSDGSYIYHGLDAGQYSITFVKAGYDSETKTIEIRAGVTTTADVLLKAKSAFSLSETVWDFGDLSINKTFYCFNNSDADCSYEISNIPVWASFSKIKGVVKGGSNDSFTVAVDRDGISAGNYSQNITIVYSGRTKGGENLLLKMSKVVLSAPTVSTATSAINVTKNTFDIDGAIVATGGSQVISYGHCWNTTGSPTISDNKTNLGITSDAGSFRSNVTNLAMNTTYYVRAYATNSLGTSYSEQITVTTQDIAVNKWDGTMASSFASGSGTSVDPYIIETGGQLLLMRSYSSQCFRLANNIDLDNNNWLPFEFNGTLDGGNYVISNLFINRNTDEQGLFSVLQGGVVKNLFVSGVKIKAGSHDSIGVIAGDFQKGEIKNCRVSLTNTSSILGNQNVGGIVGSMGNGYADETIISNCTVVADGMVIAGTQNVGGVVGYMRESYHHEIVRCRVSGKLRGGVNVGGIIGYEEYGKLNIRECWYEGTLDGMSYVGGICGRCDHNGYGCTYIYSSKADVNINVSGGYAGGLYGGASRFMNIIASYATGTISSDDSSCKDIGGLGIGADTHLCYSTVTSALKNYKQLGYLGSESNECVGSYSSDNITQYLKECYSEYAEYYNFNTTWTWTGIVNGKTVSISCPKLAWE